MEIDTKVVHGGQKPDAVTGALTPPIYQTSTFAFKDAQHGARLFKGEEEGYIYTRVGNPTIDLLAKKIALLESAEAGVVFASGLAAIFSTIISLAGSGDNVVSDDTIYGGTYSQFTQVLSRLGISSKELLRSVLEYGGRLQASFIRATEGQGELASPVPG